MADKDISFHEGTTEPTGQPTSYAWQPSGSNGGDPFNGEAFGWSGSDEPDADDPKTTFGGSGA